MTNKALVTSHAFRPSGRALSEPVDSQFPPSACASLYTVDAVLTHTHELLLLSLEPANGHMSLAYICKCCVCT